VYLDLLGHNSELVGLRILAYCLMVNHIHLVCVPEFEEALAICLRRKHGRYAQYLNARLLRSGHLWQNRFYSCPLDETHLWRAMGYVELNPV
jgi:putative transposase